MKVGIPTFSYAATKLVSRVVSEGHASINLGDFMQTIAVRRFVDELGVPKDDVVEVDRDTLPSYRGPAVAMIMNGCFLPRCFPLPDAIMPVFIGFQAKPEVLRANAAYLARFAPIGCRDTATAEACQALGIDAYVTGCLTMTIRSDAPRPVGGGKVLVVVGEGDGAFPAEALASMPDDLLVRAEFVFQRKIVHGLPLSGKDMVDFERYAAALLERYRTEADLVVTSLHHAATPCLGLGVPVVLCRTRDSSRFSYLRTIMPVHLRPDLSSIDWSPSALDMGDIRARLFSQGRAALEAVRR